MAILFFISLCFIKILLNCFTLKKKINWKWYLTTKEKGICAKPPALQVLAKFMNFFFLIFHGYLCLMCEMCIKLLFHR